MPDLLTLAADLPAVELEAGEAVVSEGERSGRVYVLEHGTLAVTRSGVAIATRAPMIGARVCALVIVPCTLLPFCAAAVEASASPRAAVAAANEPVRAARRTSDAIIRSVVL